MWHTTTCFFLPFIYEGPNPSHRHLRHQDDSSDQWLIDFHSSRHKPMSLSWHLQKRNRNKSWASPSDWEGKIIHHWESWHGSSLDSGKTFINCYTCFSPCPLSWYHRYRHACDSHFVWLPRQEFKLRSFRGHFDNRGGIEANACQWLCCLLIPNVVRA